jgi:hypothetical protein
MLTMQDETSTWVMSTRSTPHLAILGTAKVPDDGAFYILHGLEK